MSFADMLRAGYGFSDPSIVLGAALEGATVTPEPKVRVPLAMMNRHGLIAGATGTGKTKTLQLIAEQLSAAGVPVFLADIKGDVSGIAAPGEASDRVTTRAKDTGYDWKPAAFPLEFLSLTGKQGVPLRATVSSFGPLLLAKVLGLNDTQSSVLAWCSSTATTRGCRCSISPTCGRCSSTSPATGPPSCEDYGGMSKATVGRAAARDGGAGAAGRRRFFGEPEFEVADLLQTALGRPRGRERARAAGRAGQAGACSPPS